MKELGPFVSNGFLFSPLLKRFDSMVEWYQILSQEKWVAFSFNVRAH